MTLEKLFDLIPDGALIQISNGEEDLYTGTVDDFPYKLFFFLNAPVESVMAYTNDHSWEPPVLRVIVEKGDEA